MKNFYAVSMGMALTLLLGGCVYHDGYLVDGYYYGGHSYAYPYYYGYPWWGYPYGSLSFNYSYHHGHYDYPKRHYKSRYSHSDSYKYRSYRKYDGHRGSDWSSRQYESKRHDGKRNWSSGPRDRSRSGGQKWGGSDGRRKGGDVRCRRC